MLRFGVLINLVPFREALLANETTTRDIQVPFNGNHIGAFVAEPADDGNYPAVVVIHEWWGLNDHIRDVASRLAGEGLVAIAPDLFDGRVTQDPEVAGPMMMGLDQKESLGKLTAALAAVRSGSRGNAGVMGFCMGGSYALLLPIHNSDIGASVPFYGPVPGDDVLEGLHAPVMYVYAGKDQWITRDEVDRLASHLEHHGKPGEVVRYMDADHAFFNDTRPEVYRPGDAGDAWNRAIGFLKSNLGSTGPYS